jgi:ParB family transcriptional regulator, chromosome partitioning protein
LAHQISERKLSVREAEKLVLNQIQAAAPSHPSSNDRAHTAAQKNSSDKDMERLAAQLSDRWGTAVKLQVNSKGRGSFTVSFTGHESFAGILDRMGASDVLQDH